jgi:aminopeptidase N
MKYFRFSLQHNRFSMKNVFRLVTVVSLFTASVIAQESEEMEALYKTEARRYNALISRLSGTSAATEQIDVKYYKLNIRIADQKGFVRGDVFAKVFVNADTINSITYDLMSALTVDSAFVDGVKTTVTAAAKSIAIALPAQRFHGDTVTTQVYYRGNPPYTGLGSYSDVNASDQTRWIYTLSEPYGARDWWPCVDHPTDKADSMDIWITCHQSLTGVTSGKLVETVQNGDNTKTYKWKHRYPVATYLIAVTIGNFSSFSDWYKYSGTDSMEVVNYVLSNIGTTSPSYRANAALTISMLQIFKPIFGEYPFINEKYGHVQFGWSGGMEHQTLTSLGSYSFSEATIAHELVHQWFGDMITCRTWPDLWLNEGFAQYFEVVYRERMYGTSAYWSRIATRLSNAKSAVGTLYVQDTANVSNLFAGSRVYNKGASVLHMLRHVLGDSIFFAAIKSYATDPALMYGTAATIDFQTHCETVSGRDLDWFFNQWVYGEKYPKYTYYHGIDSIVNGYISRVRITQTTGTSNPAYFTMPIDLKFTATGWDTTVTVMNNAPDQMFYIPLSRRATSVSLDPEGWILRDVTFNPTTVRQDGSPYTFELMQNYPNPFNPSTTIRFSIPVTGNVKVTVYDMLGQEVETLTNEARPAGEHEIQWLPKNLSSGMYIFRLEAGSFVQSKKTTLVK